MSMTRREFLLSTAISAGVVSGIAVGATRPIKARKSKFITWYPYARNVAVYSASSMMCKLPDSEAGLLLDHMTMIVSRQADPTQKGVDGTIEIGNVVCPEAVWKAFFHKYGDVTNANTNDLEIQIIKGGKLLLKHAVLMNAGYCISTNGLMAIQNVQLMFCREPLFNNKPLKGQEIKDRTEDGTEGLILTNFYRNKGQPVSGWEEE